MKQTLLSLFLCLSLTLTGLCGLPAAAESYVQQTDLPTLYIDLPNGVSAEDITKDGRTSALLTVAAGEDSITDAPITIKGRGNSTWVLPKKPYQIRFEEKTDLLGMGAAKKWILLANYLDKTQMRNYLTLKLASAMGMDYVPECRFVDVVLNGRPQGTYLLTEKIELGKERINEDDALGGALFELEVKIRHPEDDCKACVETSRGVHVTIKDPEPALLTEQAALNADCLRFLNEVEDKLDEGYEVYSQYIDVDSFVDWYILNELAKNFDAVFWTSCYCYRSTDYVLHMGPVWDVDVCFGNQDVTYPDTVDNGLYPYNYRADKGAWYRVLFEDDTFVELVKSRWNALVEDGLLEGLLRDIDETAAALQQSEAADYALWPYTEDIWQVRVRLPQNYTYAGELDVLRQYLIARVNWLNSQWGPTETYHNRLYANELIVDVPGNELMALTGDVNDSAKEAFWNFDPNRPTNAPLGYLMASSDFGLEDGDYFYEVVYKPDLTTDPIRTDYFLLEQVSVTGGMNVKNTTAATYLTYRTGERANDGFATVRLPFTIRPGDSDRSFLCRLNALNAAGVRIRNVRLYKCGEARQTVYEVGDVNRDGEINAADALLALQYSVQLATLDPEQQELADVNLADRVNASDALRILQYSVKLIDAL